MELASALTSGEDGNKTNAGVGNGQVEAATDNTAASESEPHIATDMATVISDIMNHSERVEEHYAFGQQQLEGDAEQSAPTGLVYVKPNSHLKTQSLPILDNLVCAQKKKKKKI